MDNENTLTFKSENLANVDDKFFESFETEIKNDNYNFTICNGNAKSIKKDLVCDAAISIGFAAAAIALNATNCYFSASLVGTCSIGYAGLMVYDYLRLRKSNQVFSETYPDSKKKTKAAYIDVYLGEK